ncbi:hypothetical protein GIB67_013839 [Kingdonia uniflora]|uniref:Uncharacterized protein n=1 Tax=Kingdonia uniflora TaxID=39325 RepID=A0A7J7N404_9MAGN|nr:hypothetical protein GIB67_013839 [Kingdonia uniflora]
MDYLVMRTSEMTKSINTVCELKASVCEKNLKSRRDVASVIDLVKSWSLQGRRWRVFSWDLMVRVEVHLGC